MEKLSYTGKHFIFHIFKTEDNNVEISLSSNYVNPPVSRKELGELAKFIDSFIESDGYRDDQEWNPTPNPDFSGF